MMKKTSLITSKIIKRLKEAGGKVKKSLGQNFLVNEGIYQKIIAAAEISPQDTIFEIGPGLGILTEKLAGICRRLIAVEKDTTLASFLKKYFQDNAGVTIIENDILKFSPDQGPRLNPEYKIIGNIPYYLTGRLLRKIYQSWPMPTLAVLMIQKEVAQRITAQPPKMSLLALSVQYYSDPKIVSYVSAGSFYPAPKVDSAIIKLKTREEFRPGNQEQMRKRRKLENKFFKIATAGFRGKRKQLANSLAAGLKIPKKEIGVQLLSAGIAAARRPETLTLEEWKKITKNLSWRL